MVLWAFKFDFDHLWPTPNFCGLNSLNIHIPCWFLERNPLYHQPKLDGGPLSSRQVFSYLATALTKACLECRKYRDRSKHRKEAEGNYWWWFFPIHPVQPDLITRPLAPDAGESTFKSGRVAVGLKPSWVAQWLLIIGGHATPYIGILSYHSPNFQFLNLV